ncbi:MAG: AraC family transcriptional regulator [Bacteroidales bacterium]|nr:AraC family transcriptional regulator [Bacteroidales bacterium]
MKHVGAIWFFLLPVLAWGCGMPGQAGQDVADSAGDDAVWQELLVERLPDLNVPRNGHFLACVGGELTVIGGHTTGFIPTATAEYFQGGSWHLLDTYFPHDFGFGVVLPSEQVLAGGGCAEPFGIGQTWGVEMYDPATHSFSPLPVLDVKRGADASAARLSDGRIIVSGNWYAEDMISVYSPESGGESLRAPALGRLRPFILQTAPDNALILSSSGTRGENLAPVADRLREAPLEVPLLQEWEAWFRADVCRISDYFIGDETVGGYAWIFPAIRKADGQLGLIKVVGEEFSVLETERPLPMASADGEALTPGAILIADRENRCAWIIRSVIGTGQIDLARVDYGEALQGGKAPVSLYRAEAPGGRPVHSIGAVPMPGGRIAFAGGLTDSDNYHPDGIAFIIHTEPAQRAALPWPWIIVAAALLAAAILFLVLRHRRIRLSSVEPEDPYAELMDRITRQMEEDRLFLKKGLSKDDLARAVYSNSRYISDCINRKAGCSFTDYVNDYRIRYARHLLYENPDMRLADISEESGFSSQVTFYRNFKARTGQTPGEWLYTQKDRPGE